VVEHLDAASCLVRRRVVGVLRSIAPGKPMVMSAERGGSKADWIWGVVGHLGGQRDVTGFSWLDHTTRNGIGGSAAAGRRGRVLRRIDKTGVTVTVAA
jgi:mannan endo-1,4-beta-mannosidase